MDLYRRHYEGHILGPEFAASNSTLVAAAVLKGWPCVPTLPRVQPRKRRKAGNNYASTIGGNSATAPGTRLYTAVQGWLARLRACIQGEPERGPQYDRWIPSSKGSKGRSEARTRMQHFCCLPPVRTYLHGFCQ